VTSQPRALSKRPEVLAALVNATLVLLIPMALVILASNRIYDTSTRVTAVVSPFRFYLFDRLLEYGILFGPFAALAFAAGLRTFVHARRALDGQGSGWQGVLEAAALGFLIAFVVLLPGIVTHAPRAAVPYVVAYGGGGLILGLVLGLVLFATARLVLGLSRGQVEH